MEGPAERCGDHRRRSRSLLEAIAANPSTAVAAICCMSAIRLSLLERLRGRISRLQQHGHLSNMLLKGAGGGSYNSFPVFW